MTIEEAITVLNEQKHRNSEWYLRGEWVQGDDYYCVLEPFEAVAVAEKYQRDSQEAEMKRIHFNDWIEAGMPK
mgnify:CR=1 FL=1